MQKGSCKRISLAFCFLILRDRTFVATRFVFTELPRGASCNSDNRSRNHNINREDPSASLSRPSLACRPAAWCVRRYRNRDVWVPDSLPVHRFSRAEAAFSFWTGKASKWRSPYDATIRGGIWRICSSLHLLGRTWVDLRFTDVIAFSAEALRIGSIHVPSSIVGRFQPSLNRISFRYQMSAAFPA
jgi:hypothetical protein